MPNATTNHPLPPMPSWATDREDIDGNVPEDAWSQFTVNLGNVDTLHPDNYTRGNRVELVGRAYTIGQGDVPSMQPIIEVYSQALNNVAFSLTPQDARTLAARLLAGAEMIGG